jgi:hypothetical protein
MAIVTCTRRDDRLDERLARTGGRIIGDCTEAGLGGNVHIEEYAGRVLGTWEANGYHDSDFYALVWDGEGLTSIEYATTRGWTYHNGATADATDEVKDLAREYLADRDIAAWREATATDAATPEKGKRVVVARGRKVPIGTEGTIIWLGPDRYSDGKLYRVGVKDDAGEVHWTAERNVDVIDAGQYLTALDEIVERVRGRVARLATPGDWVSAYRSYGGAVRAPRGHHRYDAGLALLAEGETAEDVWARLDVNEQR